MNQFQNQIVATYLIIWTWPRLLISPDKVGIRARQVAQHLIKNLQLSLTAKNFLLFRISLDN